jgi:hypothetical protein
MICPAFQNQQFPSLYARNNILSIRPSKHSEENDQATKQERKKKKRS